MKAIAQVAFQVVFCRRRACHQLPHTPMLRSSCKGPKSPDWPRFPAPVQEGASTLCGAPARISLFIHESGGGFFLFPQVTKQPGEGILD